MLSHFVFIWTGKMLNLLRIFVMNIKVWKVENVKQSCIEWIAVFFQLRDFTINIDIWCVCDTILSVRHFCLHCLLCISMCSAHTSIFAYFFSTLFSRHSCACALPRQYFIFIQFCQLHFVGVCFGYFVPSCYALSSTRDAIFLLPFVKEKLFQKVIIFSNY